MNDLTTGMIGPSPAGHGREYADRVPMHRDDLEAQRAWVTAKRLHEQARTHAPRNPPAAGGSACMLKTGTSASAIGHAGPHLHCRG